MKNEAPPVRVDSPAPLKNEMLGIKKGYWICLILIGIGLFYQAFLAFGLLGLIVVYCVDVSVVDHKLSKLRKMKFQFVPDVDNDTLFRETQVTFLTKYNMMVEKTQGGIMTLTFKDYIYDIHIQEDSTFIIWRRMGLKKALISLNKYKIYKHTIEAMGIIAYEIQTAFHV